MNERFKIISRKELGQAAWDAFASQSEEAWLWHVYDLSEALAAWLGSEDASFALLDSASKDDLVALLPLRRINRRVLGILSAYALESLGGPAIRSDISAKSRRDILKTLRDQLLNRGSQGTCVEIRIFTSPMAPAFRGDRCPRVSPLLDMGCENMLTQTWVVDLRTSKDVLWSRMDGRARTAIRKAMKAGVTVRQATRNDLATYHSLHVETCRRTGAQPQPQSYFEAIWRDFLNKGLAQVWMAESNGKPVAAENFGVYKNAAVYWTGAASQQGLEVEANSLLQWTAMQWMTGNKVDWYETGEAFPQVLQGKYKGLNDFKKSFGGEMYPYYRARLPTGSWHEKLYQIKKLLGSA